MEEEEEAEEPAKKPKTEQMEDGAKEVVSNKVFVKNLPWKATEEVLQKDFTECGKIVGIRLPTNDDGSCAPMPHVLRCDL